MPDADNTGWAQILSLLTVKGKTTKFASQFFAETFAKRVIVRSSDPNYRIKIAKRQDASLPYTRKGTFKIKMAQLRAKLVHELPWESRFFDVKVRRFAFYRLTLPVAVPASVDAQALASIKRKLSSNIGNKNSLVPIAELKDLRKTIVGAAEASSKMLVSLAKFRNKADGSKYASDIWLTYSFGVSPLISDARDIARSIDDYLTRSGHSTRLTGFAALESFIVGKPIQATVSTCHYARTQAHAHAKWSVKYTGGFDFNVLSGNNYDILTHLGLNARNLPALGWELVPYSWVADYFTTAGAYMDDTFVIPPGVTVYLNKAVKFEAKCGSNISVVPFTTNGLILNQVSIPGSAEYVNFQRTKLAALPRAGLRIRSFDEVGRNATKKLLNLAAVFRSGRPL